MLTVNRYCCFEVQEAPTDYLNRERIERIWKGLVSWQPDKREGASSPEDRIFMHLCPMACMHGSRPLGSSLFVVPGHAHEARCGAAPGDLPAPHGERIYNWWENDDAPNMGPHLTLTRTPVPERPGLAADALAAATGETLSWHVPRMPDFFNHRDRLVFIPVGLDFQITPRKAALAWEWFDAFLQRAHAYPSGQTLPDGPVEIQGSVYRFQHKNLPDYYRVERLMSLSSHVECFYAPMGDCRCPECGATPEGEEVVKALTAGGPPSEPEDFLFVTPCCGTKMWFNNFRLEWAGFARFALQTLAVAYDSNDLEELGALMGAPFTVVYTHL
jgi:hypothetical protein